jgi:hypothetical protein
MSEVGEKTTVRPDELEIEMRTSQSIKCPYNSRPVVGSIKQEVIPIGVFNNTSFGASAFLAKVVIPLVFARRGIVTDMNLGIFFARKSIGFSLVIEQNSFLRDLCMQIRLDETGMK